MPMPTPWAPIRAEKVLVIVRVASDSEEPERLLQSKVVETRLSRCPFPTVRFENASWPLPCSPRFARRKMQRAASVSNGWKKIGTYLFWDGP